MTIPLIQFTLLIPIHSRRREFNFRKRSEDRYDGNTTDERGERYYFELIREAGLWKLHGINLPGWLGENEAAIVDALAEKERTGF